MKLSDLRITEVIKQHNALGRAYKVRCNNNRWYRLPDLARIAKIPYRTLFRRVHIEGWGSPTLFVPVHGRGKAGEALGKKKLEQNVVIWDHKNRREKSRYSVDKINLGTWEERQR